MKFEIGDYVLFTYGTGNYYGTIIEENAPGFFGIKTLDDDGYGEEWHSHANSLTLIFRSSPTDPGAQEYDEIMEYYEIMALGGN